MKSIKLKYSFLICCISLLFYSCAKENEAYIFTHDNNQITQLICRASHTGGEFRGVIHEYNKDGERMLENYTFEDIEGGFGLILVPISKTLEKDVDITNVYLRATVKYDAIITPTLSGRHDISGEGIIVTVKSGERTKRQYRIRGYYE